MHATPTTPRRPAFSLVEVMISVALVLIVIYGVAQVFKISSDAVGASQAASTIIRDHRAAQATMTADLKSCLSEPPLFMIASRVSFLGQDADKRGGFRDAQEEQQDADGDPLTVEVDGEKQPFALPGLPPNTLVNPPFFYTDRNPRLDRLAFFGSGLFRRQTSDPDEVSSFTTGGEAFIWYGHTHYARPTAGDRLRPSRQYASERILGRMAILMKEAGSYSDTQALKSVGSNPETDALSLAPIDFPSINAAFTNSVNNVANGGYYDMAPYTIGQWQTRAQARFEAAPLAWHWAMLDSRPENSDQFDAPPTTAVEYRPVVEPRVVRPMTTTKLGLTTPYFMGNCTQFIVEYAGDYLNQDPATGHLIAGSDEERLATWVDNPSQPVVKRGKSDGKIDFVVDKIDPATGNYTATESKWKRRTRWYGMPRDTNGDGRIDIQLENGDANRPYIPDVVPLIDLFTAYGITTKFPPHEKFFPEKRLTVIQDYMKEVSAVEGQYVAAWFKDAPAMIRVTIKLNDPTGRLQDGQWYEYVLVRQ